MKGKLMKVRKKPLAIEYVKTSELVPYAGNAKEHPADQIEQIKKSILDYGMNDPIAVWHGNEIIEGHGRLIACEELGIEEVPVIRLDDLTDEERREYALVHNKLTMNSGFDEIKLDFELSALPEFDASFFGFDTSALAEGGNGAADNYAGGGAIKRACRRILLYRPLLPWTPDKAIGENGKTHGKHLVLKARKEEKMTLRLVAACMM